MSGAGPATVTAVAAVVAAVALAVAVLLALARRRERRAFAELLARLEQLEARWAERGGEEDVERHLEAVGAANGEAGDLDPSSLAPSADVLAGMTSRVRRIVESAGGEAQSLADQAIFRVQCHLHENFTAAQLAAELFVSLRTLERGLLAGLGCTPSQLILAMKMREARRLLASGRHRVAEVADRLGFASPFHFSRRFKEFYRVAPSELRQSANG